MCFFELISEFWMRLFRAFFSSCASRAQAHRTFKLSSVFSFLLNRSSLGAPPSSFCQQLVKAQPSLVCEFGGGSDAHLDARFGLVSMLFFPEDCGTLNSSKSLQVSLLVTHRTPHVKRQTSHVTPHASFSAPPF
jgi:hypothetical protein